MAKDPVCGMDINEKDASAQTNYKGKTYYFCSESDKQTFQQNPEKYVGQQSSRKQ